MTSSSEHRKGLKFVLPIVLSLSFTGVGFMTPVVWSGNEINRLEKSINIKPQTFEPILSSQSDSSKYNSIDSLLRKAYSKGRFNGQVLYAQDGRIIYNQSFGYSNFRTKDSLTTSNLFQLASTSKPFAAVAIMILSEEGKVNIDNTVKTYLSDFPFDNITVKNLLQHRSGLPNYIYVADRHWDYRKVMTNKDITSILKKYAPNLEFVPDTRFKYCNTNYAYIASIIEQVTGKTFAQAIKEMIFDRIGMENSFVYDYTNPKHQAVVKGYSYSRKRGFYERPADYLDGVVGDKGIYSTAEELFLFDLALYNENFLSKESIELAFSPAEPFDDKHKQDYGLGFRVKEECNGQEVVYHHGWWKGFRTYFVHDYENKRTLIWLNNRSDVTIAPYINFIMNFESIQPDCKPDIQPLKAIPIVPGENYGDK